MLYSCDDCARDSCSECEVPFVIVSIYYDKEANIMFDENGVEVFDIFRWVTPNELYLFRELKQSMEFWKSDELIVELIYPHLDY